MPVDPSIIPQNQPASVGARLANLERAIGVLQATVGRINVGAITTALILDGTILGSDINSATSIAVAHLTGTTDVSSSGDVLASGQFRGAGGQPGMLRATSGNSVHFDWTGALDIYVDSTREISFFGLGQLGWDGTNIYLKSADGTTRWSGNGLGKTFVIEHPTRADRYLVHACVESPENAVAYRGRTILDEQGHARVELPDYFTELTIEGSADATSTALLRVDGSVPGPHAVGEVVKGAFCVRGEPFTAINWRVEATRADISPLIPEPLKSEVEVGGLWPYNWVRPSGQGDD